MSEVARWPVRAERRKRSWAGVSLGTEFGRGLKVAEVALRIFVELQVL